MGSDFDMARAARLSVFRMVFRNARHYFPTATASCVIAYDYARIRRLVRLGCGFYRFRVTEKQ